MRKKDPESMMYPANCIAWFCGKTDCTGCRHKKKLDAFEAWRKRTKAYRPYLSRPDYWRAEGK